MIENSNTFRSYTLTPKEYQEATQFTDVQRAFLQNELAEKAGQRLALRLDPTQLHEFIQQEAYLVGQIEFLQQLLAPSSQPAAQPTEQLPS